MTVSSATQTGAARGRESRAWSILGLVALVLFFLSFSIQQIWHVDIWVLLRIGQWVWEHGSVPVRDQFSYTVADHEWIELRWLFSVVLYLLYRLGGCDLLILFQTALLAATWGILIRPARNLLGSPPALLLVAMGVFGAASRYVVRPELVTYLFVAVFLVVLTQAARQPRTRTVWLLPLLQVVWVNSHTLFAFGPALAWSFALGERLRRGVVRRRAGAPGANHVQESRRLLIIAVLVSAACWLNPYGYRGVVFPLTLLRQLHKGSLFADWIEEFRSPFSYAGWTWDLQAAFLLGVVTVVTFVVNWRRLDPARVVVWLALAYLAAVSVRNVALFSFVSAWACLMNEHDRRCASPEAGRFFDRLRLARPVGHVALSLLLAAGSWYVATDRYTVRMGSVRRFGLGVLEGHTARRAVDFLLASGARPEVFHSMPDGSYMAWATAGRYRVCVDGRLEVYGESFFRDWLAAIHGDWEAYADRWGVNVALLLREHLGPVIQKLMASPRWALVHLDHRELIFARTIPEHTDLIRRYRIDPRAPWRPRQPEPDEALPAWRRRLGAVGTPWHSLGMAETFLFLASPDNAAVYLERGLENYPEDRRLRMLLAPIYRSRGRDAEADRLVHGLSLSADDAAWMDQLLASLLRGMEKNREARKALERAARLKPGDESIEKELADACVALGDLRAAAEHYRQAARLAATRWEYFSDWGLCAEQCGDEAGAVEAYRTALRLHPGQYQVLNQLGALLARRGDAAGALACFRRALQLNPAYEPARQNLARLESGG